MSSDNQGQTSSVGNRLGDLPLIPDLSKSVAESSSDADAVERLYGNGRGARAQQLNLTASLPYGAPQLGSTFFPSTSHTRFKREKEFCKCYKGNLTNSDRILGGDVPDEYLDPTTRKDHSVKKHAMDGTRSSWTESAKEVLSHWGRLPDVPDDMHDLLGFPSYFKWTFWDPADPDNYQEGEIAVPIKLSEYTLAVAPMFRIQEGSTWAAESELVWTTWISREIQDAIESYLPEECRDITVSDEDISRKLALSYARAAQRYARNSFNHGPFVPAPLTRDYRSDPESNLVLEEGNTEFYLAGNVGLTLPNVEGHDTIVKLRWVRQRPRHRSLTCPVSGESRGSRSAQQEFGADWLQSSMTNVSAN
ncbi:uncharacterized protein I303_100627 [Kwoniella dejecticola CBS 10117]|uniref:Uncharacterized protein n=1 Tax=Kwoniella dejecticola CBS 10117 TaxID=1296121 RepID=A0A1A6AFL0_9TREE|nr:uncharacterized protein I303_00630 [Kwoniella dejecticola CBS 10117]OBR88813.1 hypothetical protein I303_00630 [Kwoniella dejecticola CBS 10117]